MREFFDPLVPARCAQIGQVSADGAHFIGSIVAATCPPLGKYDHWVSDDCESPRPF